MVVLKLKKYINIEFFIIYFYILLDFIQVIIILNRNKYIGDFSPWNVNVNNSTVWLLFFIQVLFYVCAYKFYMSFIKRKTFFHSGLKLDKSLYIFIDYFVLFLIILNLLFYSFEAISTASSYSPSPISFLIHIISIDAIFPIYYFLNRNKGNNFLYYFNIVIYILFVLLQGWSGILLNIFIFEIYFRLKQKVKLEYFILLPVFIIFFGIFLYQFVFPIKTAIRFHRDIFSITPLSFNQSAEIFVGRLSMMGNLVAIIQYKTNILDLMNDILPNNFEILRFIRMQIPSSIADNIFSENIFYGYNIGNILGTISINSSNISNISSFSIGSSLLGTLYLLLLRSPIELILYFLLTFFVIMYIKAILDIFKNKDIYFPFFMSIIFFIHETGDTAFSFGSIFFSLTIFFIIVLFVKFFLLKFKSVKNN